jgi:TM2 domain-containing membrane protein YozV
MHIIVDKIKVMKKLTLRMITFLAFGMFMYSCSVERNSITRGESSYGIGSGMAAKNKNKQLVSKDGAIENSVVAMEQQLMKIVPVIPVQETVINLTETIQSVSGEKTVTAKSKKISVKNIAVKTAAMVNKYALSAKSMKSPLGKTATKGESKSWYLTLFLCSMFGLIGLHRVYLGYSWQAWVQLLTLGGLGIWTFIDFIRIILKKLEPRCGIYEDI